MEFVLFLVVLATLGVFFKLVTAQRKEMESKIGLFKEITRKAEINVGDRSAFEMRTMTEEELRSKYKEYVTGKETNIEKIDLVLHEMSYRNLL
jgi:hypothetical protein